MATSSGSHCDGDEPTVGDGSGDLDLLSIVFAPIADEGLTQQAVRRLTEAIHIGLLKEGERLPPETRLSEQFAIAPMTLREALAELRSAGYLETRRGRSGGTFVNRASAPTTRPLRTGTADLACLRDLSDYRRAISGEAAALAAQRGSRADVERLARQADETERAADYRDYVMRDAHFHIGVAAASGSTRLLKEQTAIEMEANTVASAHAGFPSRHSVQALVGDHAALLEALRDHCSARARLIAAMHVDRSERAMIALMTAKGVPDDPVRSTEWSPLGSTPSDEAAPASMASAAATAARRLTRDEASREAAVREVIFAPIGGEGLVQQTVRRLADGIALGLLCPGDQLPTESELSEMLGISALTLREALAVLRQVGYVETRRGRRGGTFVRRGPDSRSAASARRAIKKLTPAFLTDFNDLRRAISGGACTLAAQRASLDKLQHIEQLAQTMAGTERVEAYRQLDAAFHIAIAFASGSSRLAAAEGRLQVELGEMFAAVRTLFKEETGPLLNASNREHQELAEALVVRDAERARSIALTHVTGTRDLLAAFARTEA